MVTIFKSTNPIFLVFVKSIVLKIDTREKNLERFYVYSILVCLSSSFEKI